MAKLSEEQIVTIRVLTEQGEPASVTARRFGISEGTERIASIHLAMGVEPPPLNAIAVKALR